MEPLELPKLVRDLIREYIELQKPLVMLSPTIEDDELVFRTNPKDFIINRSILLFTRGQHNIKEIQLLANNTTIFHFTEHLSCTWKDRIRGEATPMCRIFPFLDNTRVTKGTPFEFRLKMDIPDGYKMAYIRCFPGQIN